MSNTSSNSSNSTKTVLYYGKEISVPSKAKWIHTDSNGRVYWSVVEFERLNTCFTYSGLTSSMYNECTVRFNHTEMSSINWMLSQKYIQDLPVLGVCTELGQEAHPHADLILKYAQIAQCSDKPWEEFELYNVREQAWVQNSSALQFNGALRYRLKPQSVKPEVQVGQVWESSKALVKFNVVSTYECSLTSTKYIELSYDLDVGLSIPYTVTEVTLQKHFRLVK